MMKNPEAVRSLEKDFLRQELPDYTRNIRHVEALYREAVSLGESPLKTSSGSDVGIKVARVMRLSPRP